MTTTTSAGMSSPEFALSPELAMLLPSARRLLAERAPFSRVRARLDEAVPDHDDETWRTLAELGLFGLAVPEAQGGAGLGVFALALLVEEMGRALLPGPFLASAVTATLLGRLGSELPRDLLASVLSGERVATLALSPATGEADDVTVAANGGELSGVLAHLTGGHVASLFVVPARDEHGDVGLYAVDAASPGVHVSPERVVDPTRRSARVTLSSVAARRLDGDARDALASTGAIAWTLLAAEMCGMTEAVLRMTRDYATTRRQFDRPIGAFQGVKFPLVDTMIGVELARSEALAAALDLDAGEGPTRARMAKSIAGEVVTDACRRGVQLHGGFGFTWDCDVHLYMRRGLVTRSLWGDPAHHRRALAARLFA